MNLILLSLNLYFLYRAICQRILDFRNWLIDYKVNGRELLNQSIFGYFLRFLKRVNPKILLKKLFLGKWKNFTKKTVC